MPELKPNKQVQVATPDWRTYDKVAKALTKQKGYKMYINGSIKVAMMEYIDNHPELQVKLN